MCDKCGCGDTESRPRIMIPGEELTKDDHNIHDHNHEHHHDHYHNHGTDHYHDHHHNGTDQLHRHDHSASRGKIINVEKDILSANKLMAERNRGIFEAKKLNVINLMSSPGSGKTAMLVKTINDLKTELNICVIEGDQQTMNDAERISNTGVPVVQVNTGNGCHLDAEMINRAIMKLEPSDGDVVFIENVGNLVCPSMFDLGESGRVVIMSVTEGEDKPVKYPNMFRSADLCLLNKTDLLPYLDYDISAAMGFGHRVNPALQFIKISARSGEGMTDWYEWLRKFLTKTKTGADI